MPYGLEALDCLRVEKGHVTARELDGRTTAHDVGLGGMASTKKHYVGRVLAGRPELVREDRPRLVGLVPVEPGARFRAGSVLLPDGEATGHGLGQVSSIADSPTLGHWIGARLRRRRAGGVGGQGDRRRQPGRRPVRARPRRLAALLRPRRESGCMAERASPFAAAVTEGRAGIRLSALPRGTVWQVACWPETFDDDRRRARRRLPRRGAPAGPRLGRPRTTGC